tara:strand:+ start:361222 stop:361923 length:702 start_codon:yes stop_codon:yes gene_type:complete
MNKKITSLLGSAAVASSMMVAPVTSIADDAIVTGNAGILSDYIFRGIFQDSGVGNGGLDIEYMGFYAGTWLADVGTGIEYDLYAGYIYEFESGFYLGGGYTSYQYSDNFDSEYNEINFYAGGTAGDVSIDLEYSTGEYNSDFLDKDGNIEGEDYDFMAATIGYNGAYLTYGDFGDDADDALGNYLELGYTMELGGFEVTGAIVHTMDLNDGSVDGDDEETEAYVSISWGFDVI